MRTIKITICVFSLCLFSNNILGQSGQEEYQAIAATLNYYLEGGTNNDFNTLKKAFHKNAVMSFIGDEGYKEVNALEFFGKAMKPGPKANRETYIAQITLTGTTANARLELVYPDAIVTDYMNLLKEDGQWQIVSKIFSRKVILNNTLKRPQ